MTMDTNVQSLSVNGHKIKIQLRDVIWFISMAVALMSVYFSAKNSIENNKKSIVDLYARMAIVDAGAKEAREENIVQRQQISELANQISDLIKFIRDIGPKVDKIDANVLWLMGKQVK